MRSFKSSITRFLPQRSTHPKPDGTLWVTPTDPWSIWTISGISRAICLELKRRNLLYGAIHPGARTLRHFHGPRVFYPLHARKYSSHRYPFDPEKYKNECDGIMARILRECPNGTRVIYAYLTPITEQALSLRRFRFMDISMSDAIRTGAYGHGHMTKREIETKYDDQRRMLKESTEIIVISSYAADSIARDYKYPRHKITAIGAGPAISFDEIPITNPTRYKSCRILFVGRDWKRKGGDMLIEAFREVKKEIRHATLTIVGPQNAPVQGEGIIFVKPIDRATRFGRHQLRKLYATSSIFCMPSSCETWGLAYVEAAQAGLPIVGFHEWALPDIVIDRLTGRLTRDRSAQGLAKALIDTLRSPILMANQGRNAQQHVRDVLDWPHVVDRLLSCVNPEALNGRKSVPLMQNRNHFRDKVDNRSHQKHA